LSMDEAEVKVKVKVEVSALDALQAVLLITAHLDTLLPFLLALRRVPGRVPGRVGLLQSIARDIAGDPDLARDWYTALELLSGEDLSSRSVADLLALSVEVSSNGRLGDIWRTAFEIGLLDEDMIQRWVMWEGLAGREGRTIGDAAKAGEADEMI
jgi:hypothetical protein